MTTATALKYDVVQDQGKDVSVTVFSGGEVYVATLEHPNFKNIITAISESKPDDEIVSLFDVSIAIGNEFRRLSERVTVNAGNVFFDGDRIDDSLTQTIARFHAEGNPNLEPLVRFLEKVMLNLNPHSREHLYRWLAKHHFAIANDGDFYAYKGIRPDGKSVSAGEAIVNGVKMNGNIPNAANSVIEMPRGSVTFDPKVGCSRGLHAGNWSYASTFGNGNTLLVKINPRDVVSVPTDSSDQKLRVCRYHVIKVVSQPLDTAFYPDSLAKTAKHKPEKPIDTASEPEKVEKPKRSRKAPAKATTPKAEPPDAYEDFNVRWFMAEPMENLRWLAREWGVKVPAPRTRKQYAEALNKQAAQRRKEIAEYEASQSK